MKKMDIEELVDLYTDYLIVSNSQITATRLSEILEGIVSHDKITRMLASDKFNSKYLWKKVKPMIRRFESEDGCMIVDDTIIEKPYTDENEIVCWHYDHTKGKSVKGFNIINLLYYTNGISIPVGFEVVKKDIVFTDDKGKIKRRSSLTKNELFRKMITWALKNNISFKYVLMDSWFSAKENFEFIEKKGKVFIGALKSNRLIALSLKDKYNGKFIKIGDLKLQDKEAFKGYIKGYNKEVLFVRRVFTNKDGSNATLDLVCSDTSLTPDEVATLYQKRWKVEEYHKSLKSNLCIAKSPTRTKTTQIAHMVMSMIAFLKLEWLKIKHHINHFAIKAKLLLRANMIAMSELHRLRFG